MAQERIADVAERRLLDLERQPHRLSEPVVPEAVRLVGVEREEERPRIVEAERAGVVHGAHRRGMRTGHEHAAHRSASGSADDAGVSTGTSVMTTPGSESSRSLSENSGRRATADTSDRA